MLAALPDGQARGAAAPGQGAATVILVRRGDQVHAWEDRCPHYGDTPMAWQRDAYLSADGRHIVCAAHGARFEIDTGRCVLGPCLGQGLYPVAITVDAQGGIHLTPEPESRPTP